MSITIAINESVTNKYPELDIAFITVDKLPGYNNEANKAAAEQDIVNSVLEVFPTKQSLEGHILKEAYDTFYKSMGLKPKKVSTPVQQALRIFDTKKYRSLYRIIDICMKIEYTTLVSFQVYDLGKIKSPVEYRFSSGTEQITTFQGETKTCKLGELILIDAEDVLHSCYYGNNKNKSISNATTRNLVRIMKIPGVSSPDFYSITKAFCDASGVDQYVILNKEERTASLE